MSNTYEIFCHNHSTYKDYKSSTLYIELPNSDTLRQLVEDSFNYMCTKGLLDEPQPFIEVVAGYSRVHPDDQFCKKTGREVARQNARSHTLYLRHMEIDVHLPNMLAIFETSTFYITVKLNEKDRPKILGAGLSPLSHKT